MLELISLGVAEDPVTHNLTFKGGATVENAFANLYVALINANSGTTTTVAQLQTLQKDGLTEAQEINKASGFRLVLTS
jgi:hypothetical protein